MIMEDLIVKMTEFNAGDPKRIQHFLKVYEFAHVIGIREGLDPETLHILEMAAILHDIGIRPSEEKYGRCDGKLQEQEGPAYAKEILAQFPEVTAAETDRICYLIAHHHTYNKIDEIDYQILVEADFLVNIMEDGLSKEAALKAYESIFKTTCGKMICREMFDFCS